MTPYEVMLSESQERMLVVARRGYEEQVRALFDRWELRSDVIGEVTDDGFARILDGGVEVACMSVQELTRPPQYRREGIEPEWMRELQQTAARRACRISSPSRCGRIAGAEPPAHGALAQAADADAGRRRPTASAALLRLLASPNIARSAGSSGSTTTRCSPTPSSVPAPATRPCCGCPARRAASP